MEFCNQLQDDISIKSGNDWHIPGHVSQLYHMDYQQTIYTRIYYP